MVSVVSLGQAERMAARTDWRVYGRVQGGRRNSWRRLWSRRIAGGVFWRRGRFLLGDFFIFALGINLRCHEKTPAGMPGLPNHGDFAAVAAGVFEEREDVGHAEERARGFVRLMSSSCSRGFGRRRIEWRERRGRRSPCGGLLSCR